ncbi:unnamed protein product [Mytilus coruscus]|uniref:Uncharacterized protein n=1 Tax=Mytilus coruscus TaxID=42192 RepID=A0A6J8C8X3_MYTCO|nr:unnamed protein product [Mytilus coruscus]
MYNVLQEFTGVNYGTSDQHKEGGDSRRSRDCQDLKTFLSFLISRNPFEQETSLRNIETGVSADKFVNVDNSKELGIKILKSMDGQKIDEFSFKRKEQAIILSAKSAIKVDDEVITVESQLLFQRFLAASNDIYEDQSKNSPMNYVVIPVQCLIQMGSCEQHKSLVLQMLFGERAIDAHLK